MMYHFLGDASAPVVPPRLRQPVLPRAPGPPGSPRASPPSAEVAFVFRLFFEVFLLVGHILPIW